MNEQLESQLKKDFPAFFAHIKFSCSCDDGWNDIIRWAAGQYEALAKKYEIPIYAAQVKEKFGMLEVYINNGPGSAWGVCREEAQAIAEEARSRSMACCEFCGNTNDEGAKCETRASRGGYWCRTLCLSCRVVDEADQQDFSKARANLEELRAKSEENEEKTD